MLIRSTPHTCFVILPNGLTLELCYDQRGAVRRDSVDEDAESSERRRMHSPASQGVWVFQEEVLLEVKVGQA